MARKQSKDQHEKHQAILSRMLKDDDNKYCVDCDAKGWFVTHTPPPPYIES